MAVVLCAVKMYDIALAAIHGRKARGILRGVVGIDNVEVLSPRHAIGVIGKRLGSIKSAGAGKIAIIESQIIIPANGETRQRDRAALPL